MTAALITADHLGKYFPGAKPLDDASFSLAGSECVLLLGANGSGKSTLLRILAGLLQPERGSVRYADREVRSLSVFQRAQARAFLGHDLQLYAQLTVAENYQFRCKLLRTLPAASDLEAWGLERFLSKRLHELSKGWAQRLALACTLRAPSACILLDEPSAHLDDAGVELLRKALQQRRQHGASILIASHDLSRLRHSGDRLLLLHQGVIAHDSAQSSAAATLDRYHEVNR